VFNIEECMNNEFLRPRENSCKWFNNFEVVERSVYIVKGENTQFSHKINRLNRFIKCLSRFRQQKTNQRSWCKIFTCHKLFTRKYNRIVSAGSCVYLKHFNVIYQIKCLGIKVCLCKTILTIQPKSKTSRDMAISLGVRDT